MLKFFRKIRQKLLFEQNAGKYLTYAIGEILLVVIGILLALQLNDYNQNRKDLKEEFRILSNFVIDLNDDITQLDDDIGTATERQIQIDSIYMALNAPNEFTTDQFRRYNWVILFEDQFRVNSATYDEALSASTFKLIKNDSLRAQVFGYYQHTKTNPNDQQTIKQIYEIIYPSFFKTVSTKKEFVEILRKDGSFLPEIDITEFASNEEYIAMVNNKYLNQFYQISNWMKNKELANQFLDNIQQELANRSW